MRRPIPEFPLLNSLCFHCRRRLNPLPRRSSSWSTPIRSLTTAQHPRADTPYDSPGPRPGPDILSSVFARSSMPNPRGSADLLNLITDARDRQKKKGSLTYKPPPSPHRLHVYATRHNCHITLADGSRESILSVSSGNLNFRKAGRGTYDAAFQLAAFVCAKVKNMGLLDSRYEGKGGPIKALELVLRDFGPGREAVTKILMGQEGRELRARITRVMDGTRIKFGGTRSKKPRRLG